MNLKVRLADYGQAVYSSEPNKISQTGIQNMRAPEVILGLLWDSKVDIWSAACFVSMARPLLGYTNTYMLACVENLSSFQKSTFL